MHKINLTKAQRRMYSIIVSYITERQHSPSIRELAELAGYKSTSTVYGLIQHLIKKGYVAMEPRCPRTLKIIEGR